MGKRINMKPRYLLLFISPILILFLGLLYKSFVIRHYVHSVDADYAYLFNSLSMARFEFRVFHVDHPGTPMQVLSAIIIKVVHLFTGKAELVDDVLLDPEKYLFAIGYFMIGLNALGNLFMGLSIFKITGRLIDTLFLQFSPFIALNVLATLRRLLPETLLIFGLSILIVACIYIYHNKQKNVHALLIGLLVGWCIACKINTAFLVLVPVFMFEGVKKKLIYLLSSVIGFFVFGFTVILRSDKFFLWVKNILTHKGGYGGGEEGFADKEMFFAGMESIFSRNITWTILFVFSVLVLTLHVIPRINKVFVRNKNIHIRSLLGLVLGWLIHLLMVGKHYSYRYLLPGLVLTFFTYYTAVYTIKFRREHIKSILLIFPVVSLFIFMLPKYPEYVTTHKNNYERHRESFEFYEKEIQGKPIVFVPFYNGGPMKEYALSFGAWWSGPGEEQLEYCKTMKKHYPKSFMYKEDQKRILWWEEEKTATELINEYPELYLFVGDGKKEVKPLVLDMFKQACDSLEINSIYFNSKTDEEFIQIKKCI